MFYAASAYTAIITYTKQKTTRIKRRRGAAGTTFERREPYSENQRVLNHFIINLVHFRVRKRRKTEVRKVVVVVLPVCARIFRIITNQYHTR